MSRTVKRAYAGVKAISPSCQHKTCPWCAANRTRKDRRLKEFAEDQEQDTGDPCQDGGCRECAEAV